MTIQTTGDAFRRLFDAGLHGLDQDQVNRLCALLVLHLEVDRALSWVLHMYKHGNDPKSDATFPTKRQFDAISKDGFKARLDLVREYGLLEKDPYDALDRLNDTRNDLVHLGKGRPRIHVQEAISREATFARIWDEAREALNVLSEPIDRVTRAPDPGS